MTLEELVKLFKSYDSLRTEGIKRNEYEVVAMCDRNMDRVQDLIIDLETNQ